MVNSSLSDIIGDGFLFLTTSSLSMGFEFGAYHNYIQKHDLTEMIILGVIGMGCLYASVKGIKNLVDDIKKYFH